MAQTETPIQQLFQDFQEWRMRRSPEFASLAGVAGHDTELEEWSLQRFEDDEKACQGFRDRVRVFLSDDDAFSAEEKLNLKLLESELSTFIDGYQYKGYLFPINYMEGVHNDFERLADWTSPNTDKAFENLAIRYEKFSAHADGIINMLQEGIRQKLTNHKASMNGVVDTMKKHVESPVKETNFYQPFKDCKNEEIVKRAEEAIAASVQPGFAKLASFIEESYLPALRPSHAATSLPNGAEYYAACIKFHTSLSLTPQEIHEMGLKEVARIEGEMQKISEQVGFKGKNLSEFMDSLRKDPKFYYNSEAELLQGFRDLVEKTIAPKITDIFTHYPVSELVLTESLSAAAPAAFYIAGTPDGSRPGKFFVNSKNYKSQPKYDMLTLSLHEANPGHHLEGSFKIAQKGVPAFRQNMEDRNYFQAPSRFPINTAYVEGWGLYAESLGFDMGLYDDPYDRLGHYSAEVFRACRLVVDTGLHALGWTWQQAVDYMLTHSASSRGHVELEVNRYITWPGQALGYKIGQMKIADLRKKAERELGDKFDLKKFHDVLLRAAGPLDVVEGEVVDFIKKSKLAE